jgi:hypothetical protein
MSRDSFYETLARITCTVVLHEDSELKRLTIHSTVSVFLHKSRVVVFVAMWWRCVDTLRGGDFLANVVSCRGVADMWWI